MCLFQVDVRQGGGALALIGEPIEGSQAKFVPASAQHFQSTQVIVKDTTTGQQGTRFVPLSLFSGQIMYVF